MAKQTITKLTDDLTGGTADRTVAFGWAGRNYEIDLSKRNIAAFEKALKPYLEAARRTRGAGSRAARRSTSHAVTARNSTVQDIREWARANGHDVSERGRIPNAIVDAFNAAN